MRDNYLLGVWHIIISSTIATTLSIITIIRIMAIVLTSSIITRV